MYTIVALNFVLTYLVSGTEPVTDAAGAAWRTGDVFETAAITSLLTMIFVTALAAIKVVQAPSAPQRKARK